MQRCEVGYDVEERLGRELTDEEVEAIRFEADALIRPPEQLLLALG